MTTALAASATANVLSLFVPPCRRPQVIPTIVVEVDELVVTLVLVDVEELVEDEVDDVVTVDDDVLELVDELVEEEVEEEVEVVAAAIVAFDMQVFAPPEAPPTVIVAPALLQTGTRLVVEVDVEVVVCAPASVGSRAKARSTSQRVGFCMIPPRVTVRRRPAGIAARSARATSHRR
jgi:hypothetical protein